MTTAVARGDLSRKITVDVKGEILELKNTILFGFFPPNSLKMPPHSEHLTVMGTETQQLPRLNPCSRTEGRAARGHSASQLSLGLDEEGGYFDGMSHSDTLLVLRNLGPQACSVPAQPTLAFEDAQHHPLRVSLQRPPGMHPGPVILPVAIPVGAEVTSQMRWVSGDGYDGHNCVSPAFVTIPLEADTLSVPFNGSLCGPAGSPPTYTMPPLQRDPVYTPPTP